MAKKRRYSDEERATAIAALAANGGNIERTARQLGIPRTTLIHWNDRDRQPEASIMARKKPKRLFRPVINLETHQKRWWYPHEAQELARLAKASKPAQERTRFVVPAGVPCQIRKHRTKQWHDHTTQHTSTFSAFLWRNEGWYGFLRDHWELKVPAIHVQEK